MTLSVCKLSDISDEAKTSAFKKLSSSQKEYILSKPKEKQDQSIAVRALLDKLLLKEGAATDISSLAFDGKGRPCLSGSDDLFISLSHSADMIACAVSNRPVGIDVQSVCEVSDKLIDRVCTPYEKDYVIRNGKEIFMQIWTAKEAYKKVSGETFAEAVKANVLDFENSKSGKIDNYYWSAIEL